MKTPLHASVLLGRQTGGLLLLLLLAAGYAQAQCKQQVSTCEKKLYPFNNDGDFYRAELFEDEKASLNFFCYNGITYRVVPCGVSSKGSRLQIEVYDQRGVGVFHSRNLPNEPYYDFTFGASGYYRIVARFPEGEGCASLVIGYLESEKAKALTSGQ